MVFSSYQAEADFALLAVGQAAVCAWIDRGQAAHAPRFWTCDPIDGTKGFLRGNRGILASNGQLHPPALQALKGCGV